MTVLISHALAAILLSVPNLTAASSSRPVQEPQQEARPQQTGTLESSAAQGPSVDPRLRLVERDRRLSFTSAAADRARRYLRTEHPGMGPREIRRRRASALMALGCGGARRDLELLESYAESGKLSTRRAAILALGEMGPNALGALQRLLAANSANLIGLEETLLLALLHTDSANAEGDSQHPALNYFRTLLDDERSELRSAARFLGEFALGAPPPRALPALDDYYELRWSAAREYGFIDDQRWGELKLGKLLQDETFIARYLLASVDDLPREIVRSHLIELLTEEHGEGLLAGVLRGAPGALDFFYREKLWRPASESEWSELLAELDESMALGASAELVSGAFESARGPAGGFGGLAEQAALLMLRSGSEAPAGWLADVQASGSPARTAALLNTLGGLQDPVHIALIRAALTRFPAALVQQTGTIALARLRDSEATLLLEETLRGDSGPGRLLALQLLGLHARDPLVARLLKITLQGPTPTLEESIALAIGMARGGYLPQRDLLRMWLRSGNEPRAERASVVRALAAEPTPTDLEFFRAVFPSDGEPQLNIELALVLGRDRAPLTLKLLRAGLWGENWNLSVIAAGLIHKRLGLRTLLDELHTPPVYATDEHLRRVGFGIGEWGGLPAVEELARNLNERDPGLQGAYLGALAQRHP